MLHLPAGQLLQLTKLQSIWMSDIPVVTLISNNYFFISANVIGMFTSYFMELSARKEFYMRILLEREKENVKIANNELEERVQERTISSPMQILI